MLKRKTLPAAEYLWQRFGYDPETGELRWKPQPREAIADLRCWASWNGKRAGKIAGNINNYGYRVVAVDYISYSVHRIIYKMMTGEEPPLDDIDHKDGNKSNNRWDNLRAATRDQNLWNSGVTSANKNSGYRGVKKLKDKWQARIQVNGVMRHIGTFDTAEDASAAYEQIAREAHAEFYNERRVA